MVPSKPRLVTALACALATSCFDLKPGMYVFTADAGTLTSSDCSQTCTKPPSNKCIDGTRLEAFANRGRCSADGCAYTPVVLGCGSSCKAGLCIGEPCTSVFCDGPPAALCVDADHARVSEAGGSCSDGRCVYQSKVVACPGGCAEGVCKGNLCEGKRCDSPAGPTCVDAKTLRVFVSPGQCSDGQCRYSSADLPCAQGCANGACVNDPCAGVACTQPPADTCVDGSTRRSFKPSGTCRGGSCTYLGSETACALGESCSQGTCRARLGGPCSGDEACALVGEGAQCRQSNAAGGVFTGGYCSVPCTKPYSACDQGNGVCRGGPDDQYYYGTGDHHPRCFAKCLVPGTQASCRDGYTCTYFGQASVGYCDLALRPQFDGGGLARTGEPCAGDSQCQGPPDPLFGFCASERGGSVGGRRGGAQDGGVDLPPMPNGSCTAECSAARGTDFCGANGACAFTFDQLTNRFTGAYCQRTCSLGSGVRELRPGYTCWTAGVGDGGTIGIAALKLPCRSDSGVELEPFCTATGKTCDDSTGYCCEADGGECGLNIAMVTW